MRRSLLITALSLSLVACGGGGASVDELHTSGLDKLSAGDFEGAVTALEQAAAATDDAAVKLDIQKDLASARVHTDAPTAAEDFMYMAGENPAEFTANDFVNFGRELHEADAVSEAITVVDSGLKRFGETESPNLNALMGELVKASQASGDAASLEKLKSLGYVGD
ncbi:MAG: hypothetical protein ACYSWX_03340 [Planctomycetota bacterium]|jgi:hypothetical protein